ncbi:DUF3021 domain-containing protein [Fructobacillus americanaquae]|uniref:DUF3021 domain-containing protein n=1 Tax=Fructobacillus americanaquae TaxID=2940302 RepID=A0ABY5C1C6_9LACO|nr:DUF3021 domain-containing protein [Fructobacillus americanaquae]USS92584.1 DUF3021 domain-containing protein [Fructobacillus americanaquae]
MKKLFLKMIRGMEYGSLTYLLALLLSAQTIKVTTKDIVGVLLMSAAIGLLTLIFTIERLSYLMAIVIHLLGTFALVVLTDQLTGGFHGILNWNFWLIFVTAYLVIWLIIKVDQQTQVDRINAALKKVQTK